MSSHREAPEISKDPVADNTDVYAFVSPDQPDTVTMIANFIPLEGPAGGPNFYEFGDDVLYEINVDNNGDGDADITYQFQFQTQTRNPDTFLYNTGPISSLSDPNWNRPQFYSVTKVKHGVSTVLGSNLPCPPCNIGPTSTPNYAANLAQPAVQTLNSGEVVFAGQRAEGFYVDLGSVFDLLDLRPFQSLFFNPMPDTHGVNGLDKLNVHSIAIQVPKTDLTRDGSNPKDPNSKKSVIGIWAKASRRKARIFEKGQGGSKESGPWVQVSRLGNPLINEAIIPIGKKNYWNAEYPKGDSQFVQYYQHPEVSSLLPNLYPGVFPDLAGYTKARADVVAILLTGLPSGIISGFQNYTGSVQSDMLRLNMAIPPTKQPNILGILGGDLAGFPNGRRYLDDVFTIELRVLAGVTIPLVDPSYTPDPAASEVTDGVTPKDITNSYLKKFPYLGVPYDGYDYPRH
jgi:hypothetical protein